MIINKCQGKRYKFEESLRQQQHENQGKIQATESEEDDVDLNGSVNQVPDELVGVAQPSVDTQQKQYVLYDQQKIQEEGSWTEENSITQKTNVNKFKQKGKDLFQDQQVQAQQQSMIPEGVTKSQIQILQAPAMFSTPILQKKTFKPIFKVQLQFQYQSNQDCETSIRVDAYSIHEPNIKDIQYWKPQASQQMELEGYQSQKIVKFMKVKEAKEEQIINFEFPDLKFKKSTRMAKRWLIFAFQVYNDTIFCLYLLPSIILSRRNDQYWKAYELLQPPLGQKRLRQQNQIAPQLKPQEIQSAFDGKEISDADLQIPSNVNHAKTHILSKYEERGFQRQLQAEDIQWLLRKSGFQLGNEHCQSEVWLEFVEWFQKTLNALSLIRGLWNLSNPQCFCSFWIDRNYSEIHLRGKSQGAFVLRISSQAGCFVISSSVWHEETQGVEIEHSIIDTYDLEKGHLTLNQYVIANNKAKYLLDLQSKNLYPKEKIFQCQNSPYIQQNQQTQMQHALRHSHSESNEFQLFQKNQLQEQNNLNSDQSAKTLNFSLQRQISLDRQRQIGLHNTNYKDSINQNQTLQNFKGNYSNGFDPSRKASQQAIDQLYKNLEQQQIEQLSNLGLNDKEFLQRQQFLNQQMEEQNKQFRQLQKQKEILQMQQIQFLKQQTELHNRFGAQNQGGIEKQNASVSLDSSIPMGIFEEQDLNIDIDSLQNNFSGYLQNRQQQQQQQLQQQQMALENQQQQYQESLQQLRQQQFLQSQQYQNQPQHTADTNQQIQGFTQSSFGPLKSKNYNQSFI